MRFIFVLSIALIAACSNDRIRHNTNPSITSDVGPVDIGVDTGMVDTGIIDTGIPDVGIDDTGTPADPCAACDPPRFGFFCGYRAGCDNPQRACYNDHSGDAALIYFCDCNGNTFAPDRYGTTEPGGAADQPHQGIGECPMLVDAATSPDAG